MPIGVGKISNDYARYVSRIDAPKTVWMAIAVSFANRINEGVFDGVERLVMDEWQTLHDNGIVPQRPPRQRSDIPPRAAEEYFCTCRSVLPTPNECPIHMKPKAEGQ